MMKVVWDNSQHNIIRLDYYHPINSWEEYRAAVHQAHTLARSVDHPVNIIHNGHGVEMPPGAKDRLMEELSMTIKDVPENVELMISITTMPIENQTRLLSNNGTKVYMADSIDAAYHLIESHSATASFS